ncbi:hypothetical protein COO60DRAFT_1703070 [Scenedesmus sp. NREL 46B-D3]|nr:hypothetical protein COO60DRAFT_1703070 [Scenedesmus sp. NREL 46B-D3]
MSSGPVLEAADQITATSKALSDSKAVTAGRLHNERAANKDLEQVLAADDARVGNLEGATRVLQAQVASQQGTITSQASAVIERDALVLQLAEMQQVAQGCAGPWRHPGQAGQIHARGPAGDPRVSVLAPAATSATHWWLMWQQLETSSSSDTANLTAASDGQRPTASSSRFSSSPVPAAAGASHLLLMAALQAQVASQQGTITSQASAVSERDALVLQLAEMQQVAQYLHDDEELQGAVLATVAAKDAELLAAATAPTETAEAATQTVAGAESAALATAVAATATTAAEVEAAESASVETQTSTAESAALATAAEVGAAAAAAAVCGVAARCPGVILGRQAKPAHVDQLATRVPCCCWSPAAATSATKPLRGAEPAADGGRPLPITSCCQVSI